MQAFDNSEVIKHNQFLLALEKFLIFFMLLFSLFLSSNSFTNTLNSFPQAKRLAQKIFDDHRNTLYCSCRYDKDKTVNLLSCNMSDAILIKRARRVEWEHMMPAEHFGHDLACWKKPLCKKKDKYYKGRRCCSSIDPLFKQMEGELYNLWPAVGLVNQARSNYLYDVIKGKKKFYGCQFKVDKSKKIIEPPDAVKGLVARANLFMAYYYHITIDSEHNKLYEKWNLNFPPSEWEKSWAKKVAEIEGYSNPFIRMDS